MCASAAPEGLALAADEHPDLVITDVLLPGMSGYEAAEHLRRNPLTRNIPILALTAFAMPDERARAKAAGCDHYLPRVPGRTERLLGCVGAFPSEDISALGAWAISHRSPQRDRTCQGGGRSGTVRIP